MIFFDKKQERRISEIISSICLKATGLYKKGWADLWESTPQTEWYKQNRAISDGIRDSIVVFQRELRIDNRVKRELSRNKDRLDGYIENSKRELFHKLGQDIYESGMFDYEQFNNFQEEQLRIAVYVIKTK